VFRYIIVTVKDRQDIPELVKKLNKLTLCAQAFPVVELPNVLRVDIVEEVSRDDAEILRSAIIKKYGKYLYDITPVIPDGKPTTIREKEHKKRRERKTSSESVAQKDISATFVILVAFGMLVASIGLFLMITESETFENITTLKIRDIEIPFFSRGSYIFYGGLIIISLAIILRRRL